MILQCTSVDRIYRAPIPYKHHWHFQQLPPLSKKENGGMTVGMNQRDVQQVTDVENFTFIGVFIAGVLRVYVLL